MNLQQQLQRRRSSFARMGTVLLVALAATRARTAAAQACATAPAGCSEYSLISSGTCAATAGCSALVTEGACSALHTLVDVAFVQGNGQFTVGASQQSAWPGGCVLKTSNMRHKFNTFLASSVDCSAEVNCFCLGDCQPIGAHPSPANVSTTPGQSGGGGTGSGEANQPKTSSATVGAPLLGLLLLAVGQNLRL